MSSGWGKILWRLHASGLLTTSSLRSYTRLLLTSTERVSTPVAVPTGGISAAVRNVRFVAVLRVLPRISNPVLTLTAAHLLRPNLYGEYVTAMAFVAILSQYVDNGLNQFLVRDIAVRRNPLSNYVWSAIILKAALVIPVMGLMFVLAKGLRYDGGTIALIVVISCGLFLGS